MGLGGGCAVCFGEAWWMQGGHGVDSYDVKFHGFPLFPAFFLGGGGWALCAFCRISGVLLGRAWGFSGACWVSAVLVLYASCNDSRFFPVVFIFILLECTLS